MLDLANIIKKQLSIESVNATYIARLAVCGSCIELRVKDVSSHLYKVCNSCGCVLAVKARILEARCPKNLWTA